MTFSSLYEMFDPLTTVRKQRFWDWFSGDDRKAWWTYNNIDSSTDASAMNDTVDGGYALITGTPTGARCALNFGDKRQYAHDGSVIIGVISPDTITNSGIAVGLADQEDAVSAGDYAFATFDTAAEATYFYTRTGDGSTSSNTNTTIAFDTNWHNHKLQLGSSNVIHSIDGTVEVTKTTNRPDTKLQPTLYAIHRTTGGTIQNNIRYVEAYNT